MLNLGCGNTFHPEWVNIDFHDHGGAVIAYDLRLGIPFADNTFDVVYHSHVLEHFSREGGKKFLAECFRVLKPGRLLRLAVPDLEGVARAYLQAVSDARNGSVGAMARHEWMIIELIDQMTRQKSGGEMLRYWQRDPIPEEAFMLARSGSEAKNYIKKFKQSPVIAKTEVDAAITAPDVAFLTSGELHRWMYDEVSLKTLLNEIGFCNILKQKYNKSADPEILRYGLDADTEQTMRKPDSLFIEAYKPNNGHKQPKLMIVSSSDSGGAGIAARRLHEALLGRDVVSQMYVAAKYASAGRVYVPPSPNQKISVHPDNHVELSGYGAYNHKRFALIERDYPKHQWIEYFTTPGQCVDLRALPFYDDFDVISLNWLSGFIDPALSLQALKGRPLIWTMHDMNPFTGGCHYAGNCRAFIKQCGTCPLLGSSDEKDLSFQTWRARMSVYRRLNLHIVCTTRWMAEKVRQSSLLGRFPVTVLPYSIPLEVFRPMNRAELRRELGLDKDDFILLFSAQSISNKRKGGVYVVEAMRELAKTSLAACTKLLLLGHNPPNEILNTGIEAVQFGHINCNQRLAVVYNIADALLFPSLEEAYGQVTTEAIACGTPTIAFATDGIPETIQHEHTGWLAQTGSSKELLEGIFWAEKMRHEPDLHLRCRAYALEHWSYQHTTQKYLELVYKLIGKTT